jgi:hypothetical protein
VPIAAVPLSAEEMDEPTWDELDGIIADVVAPSERPSSVGERLRCAAPPTAQ